MTCIGPALAYIYMEIIAQLCAVRLHTIANIQPNIHFQKNYSLNGREKTCSMWVLYLGFGRTLALSESNLRMQLGRAWP